MIVRIVECTPLEGALKKKDVSWKGWGLRNCIVCSVLRLVWAGCSPDVGLDEKKKMWSEDAGNSVSTNKCVYTEQ